MLKQPIQFAELIDVASLQTLMDSLNQVIGIANGIIDIQGNVITRSGWQDSCANFHRANPQTCSNCIESDTSLVKSMLKGENYAIYNCLNGLVDAAMPIIVDGQHVANIFTGQCLLEAPDLEKFRHQAQEYGFDEEHYLQAIAKLPVIDKQRLESITKMYAELAQALATQGYDRLRQKQTTAELAKLNDELSQHIDERTKQLQQSNQLLQSEKRALAASEARLNALFKNMRNGVAVFKPSEDGRDFVFIGFNKAAEQIEKITRREVIGKRLSDMFPGIKSFGLFDILQRVEKTGHPEAMPVAYYQDKRIQGWRENYVYKLPSGEIVSVYNDVTERKQYEQALRDNESNLKAYFDNSPIGINVFDKHGKLLIVNRAARRMLDMAANDSFDKYCLFDDPDIRPETKAALYHGLSISEERAIEVQQFKRHSVYAPANNLDSHVYLHLTFTPCFTEDQDLAGYIASIVDITERKRTEKNLHLTQFSVDWATDCLFWITADGHFQFVNNTACRILGYTREELLKLNVSDIDPHFQRDQWPAHWQELKHKGSMQLESMHCCKDGKLIPVEIAANYLVFEGQEYNCAFVRDISERKALQAELERQARIDYLTGLANRRYFMEQGEAELARVHRYGNQLSIFMLDIDYFKSINDNHGHAVGDLVLRKLGSIFLDVLREIDIPGRLGGEEFAVLLPETNQEKALEVAERLRLVIADTRIPLDGEKTLHFTVSIGIAHLKDSKVTISTLLNLADKALYQAKQTGRNKVCVYQPA